MIPGLVYMPPAGGAAGGGGASGLSFTFVGSTTSTADTITPHANALAGDWAVLFDAATSSDGSVTSVVPSGWSSRVDTNLSGSQAYRMIISDRILVNRNTVTGMAKGWSIGTNSVTKIMAVFRPSTSIVSRVSSTWNAQITTGNPSSQTVTASGVTAPLIVLAFAAASTSSAPSFSTETPAMTNLTRTNSGLSLRVGYTIYNTSPANQSIDIDDVGTQGLQSGYVRFT